MGSKQVKQSSRAHEETIAGLIQRLAETEAALRAALEGEVDAIIDPVRATPILLRETQEALAEAEARFARLIARTAAMIFELHPAGTTLFVNEAVITATGYSAQELLGANWWERFFPGDRISEANRLRQHLHTQDVTQYEMLLTVKDGSTLILELNTANYYSETGALDKIVGLGIDVTQRRLAERELDRHRQHLEEMIAQRTAELEAERARLSDLIDSVPGIVWEIRGEPQLENIRFNFISPYIEKVTGYTVAEWLSTPNVALSGLHPDDQDRTIRELEAIMASGEIGIVQARWIAKDGRVVWVEDHVVPVLSAEGHPVGLRGVAIDITDRLQTQEALAEAEARYRAIGESIPFGVWVCDAEGRIEYVSQSFLDLIGMTLEETRKSGWGDRLPPESREQVLQDWADAVREGRSLWNCEYPIRGVDGVYYTALSRGVPIRDAQGRIVNWVGVHLDITERKRIEDRTARLHTFTAALSGALSSEQVAQVTLQQLQVAVQGSSCTLMLLDPEEQALSLVASSASTELAGHYTHIRLEDRTPLSDAARMAQPVWIETADEYALRYPDLAAALAATGSQAAACMPLIADDRVIGVLGISFRRPHPLSKGDRAFFQAIAHQCALALDRARLYEAEIESRRSAEEANAIKIQFLAMVSHELRTPLTAIQGFVSTLLATDVIWQPRQQREFLEIIGEETLKLNDLVEQLVDLSRIQSGTLRVDQEPVSSRQLIESAMLHLSTLGGNHELLFSLPDDLPVVRADSRRIAQVLTNLVGNAAKYSPEGSRIYVRARAERDFLHIDISDDGPGIPPAQREHVFKAFHRLEAGAKADRTGAGLGLAISKGLIEAHGGRIWIDPQTTVGTTVCFTLPIEPPG